MSQFCFKTRGKFGLKSDDANLWCSFNKKGGYDQKKILISPEDEILIPADIRILFDCFWV